MQNLEPNTYPASEEPLIDVFIKKFFNPPTTTDRVILHKNGKVTRNGYEVRAISEKEAKKISKKENMVSKEEEKVETKEPQTFPFSIKSKIRYKYKK